MLNERRNFFVDKGEAVTLRWILSCFYGKQTEDGLKKTRVYIVYKNCFLSGRSSLNSPWNDEKDSEV